MTFIEAALEILLIEQAPLHAKEIAKRAIDGDMLTHVGKMPEQTMSKSISESVSKGKGPFVRVKPGVFGLENWGEKRKTSPRAKPARRTRTEKQPKEDSLNRPSRKERDKPPLRESAGKKAVSENAKDTPRKSIPKTGKVQDNGTAQNNSSAKERDGAPRRGRGQSDKRNGTEQRRNRDRNENSSKNKKNSAAGFMDRIESILRESTHPVKAEQVSGELKLKSSRGPSIVNWMLDADNEQRVRAGRRPRFVSHKNGWTLLEREISSEIRGLEDDIYEKVDRLSRVAGRQVVRKLRRLSLERLARVVVLYLRKIGFEDIEPVDRGDKDEIHITVLDRRQGGRFSTAVVVRGGQGKAVSERDVVALRGAMHHYDAMRGLIISAGEIGESAVREAEIDNLPPVGLIDGKLLGAQMVAHGIGVEKRMVEMSVFDETQF